MTTYTQSASQYLKDWRAKNKVKVLQYRNSLKEKARNAEKASRNRGANQVPLTPIEQEWLMEYYAEAIRQGKTVDHIVPNCHGGVHAPWNLQIISQSENSKKRQINKETRRV